MATWPDPRAISVGFAFGRTQYEDPTGLTYEIVSPADDPDDGNDPGPVLESVTWTRGRIGDAPETSPTSIDLRMRNTDGDFSPRNVTGPRYGALREGTPGRLYVDVGSGPQVLATAHALGFQPSSTGPGIDPQVHVPALGVLNRISRDTETRSALNITIGRAARDPSNGIVAYWPMEDLGGQFGSALPNGAAIAASDDVEFASDSELVGSAPLAVLGVASTVVAAFGDASSLDGSWDWRFFVKYPAGPASLTLLADVAVVGGTVARVTLAADATTAYLTAYNSAGAIIASDSTTQFRTHLFSGETVVLIIEIDASSTLVAAQVRTAGSATGSNLLTAFHASFTSGYPTVGTLPASAVLVGAVVGHMTLVDSDVSFPTSANGEIGYPGERARDRVARLVSGAAIPADIPVAVDSSLMGAQAAGVLYPLLRGAEDVDGGVLYELRDGQLTFQTLEARYNIPAAMVLAFGDENDSGDISDLKQLDDGRDTYNIVTASSPDGSFAVVEETDGPVGSDTTTGIGPRPVPVFRNVAESSQLDHQAGWILRRETIDKPRYIVVLDLHADPELVADWLACDIGSRIQITGAPSEDHGPDTLDLIIEGERGTVDAARFLVALFCEPYEPYRVQQLTETPPDDDLLDGWLIPDWFALRAAVDDDDTSWLVDCLPRMTTDADDMPCRTLAAGEEAAITAVSTTAVTFVAAGTAAHASNANVTPTLPAGHAANDLLLIYAAIRNSGAGVPQAPAGYTRTRVFPPTSNAQVFAKIHDGSESDPTVTFTGGVANADTSAQMAAFRGVPVTLADLADIVIASDTQLNASAQDIAVPHLSLTPYAGQLVLAFGWKQDDWTSVAPPTGFTEIGEPDTTTGDDQGLTWAYRIDTTPAEVLITASFVVTGGAGAVSRSAVAALYGGFQTVTVTRSVNDVEKSHAAGIEIELADPLVLSL